MGSLKSQMALTAQATAKEIYKTPVLYIFFAVAWAVRAIWLLREPPERTPVCTQLSKSLVITKDLLNCVHTGVAVTSFPCFSFLWKTEPASLVSY